MISLRKTWFSFEKEWYDTPPHFIRGGVVFNLFFNAVNWQSFTG